MERLARSSLSDRAALHVGDETWLDGEDIELNQR
jgi:hypothetical protein